MYDQHAPDSDASDPGATIVLSPFPVRIPHYPAETARSFFQRLCRANGISEADARLHMRHHDPKIRTKVDSPPGLRYIAELGGLSKDPFREKWSRTGVKYRASTDYREPVRGEALQPSILCRRCARGERVEVTRLIGPICIRHRRWILGDERDAEVVLTPRQLSAQRCLNGTLHARGIGYTSLAVSSAREALRRVKRERPRQDRYEPIPLEQELAEFADVVLLTAHLTSPAMVAILLNDELSMTMRGIAIAYATYIQIEGGDVAAAIAKIQTRGPEIILAPGTEPVGVPDSRRSIPDFVDAILNSNDSLRIRLLRFLYWGEDSRWRGAIYSAAIEHAVIIDEP